MTKIARPSGVPTARDIRAIIPPNAGFCFARPSTEAIPMAIETKKALVR